MDKHLNDSITYIENHLCDEIDLQEIAKRSCVTADSFLRFFSYITGMTLKEYIRRRRLTLAADDLRNTTDKVIDIAIKYGYDSADAFSRAFRDQHSILPSAYRKHGGPLRIYPPASFHIIVKGAKEMNFQLITLPETTVYGIGKPYDKQGYKNHEELRHKMWNEDLIDAPHTICGSRWNAPNDTSYDGVWYGVWHDGAYMIAREKEKVKNEDLETYTIPAGTYAVFVTERGGFAWEEFPRLRTLIFDSWLPTSGYKQKEDFVIEVLHLWQDHDLRQKNRYYEMWIPVEK